MIAMSDNIEPDPLDGKIRNVCPSCGFETAEDGTCPHCGSVMKQGFKIGDVDAAVRYSQEKKLERLNLSIEACQRCDRRELKGDLEAFPTEGDGLCDYHRGRVVERKESMNKVDPEAFQDLHVTEDGEGEGDME